ncbi:unnamed protein product [Medioppia subpectinata]|uniref:Uncharacterized protein n=1 Tax=Medioppia subpectinata TaxID=1979941 RepID=A0A7R9Q384_9ACAR|nr:unnamed protein product [Medioppia subpectinata]CAG2111051.1 unnamed protein product [Medioppia subpectinata]
MCAKASRSVPSVTPAVHDISTPVYDEQRSGPSLRSLFLPHR